LILDVTDPAAPVQLSVLPLTGAFGLIVREPLAHVVDHAGRLGIFDVSGPAAPAQLGQVYLPYRVVRLAVDANYAYVLTEENGLYIVAVTDPTDSGGQPRGKQVLKPGGIFYWGTSGIWQTVWLEPVPAAHIGRLSLMPDLDGFAVLREIRRGERGFGGLGWLSGVAARRVSTSRR
jgi:hypothetical protein